MHFVKTTGCLCEQTVCNLMAAEMFHVTALHCISVLPSILFQTGSVMFQPCYTNGRLPPHTNDSTLLCTLLLINRSKNKQVGKIDLDIRREEFE